MLERLKLIRAAARLIRNPESLGEVFDMIDSLAKTDDLTPLIAELRESSGTAMQAFAQRTRVAPIGLDELASLPADTLGNQFARHCRQNDLDPAVFHGRSADTETAYLITHLMESHDIWHVITGFGTDVSGEIGLQAFSLAQFLSPFAMMIVPMGLLNALIYNRDDYTYRMDSIADGWRLGRQAAPFFGYDWTSAWHRPVDEIRNELRVSSQRNMQRAA